MSSVKGTREEGEALETSIKERKKSHLKGVKGVEQYFLPHFPDSSTLHSNTICSQMYSELH